jgi:transmembrane sensor
MAEYERSRCIDEQAADWVARSDRSPLSAQDAAELDAWLGADPRHRGAFLRANALAMMSESAQALGPGYDPQHFAAATSSVGARRPSRRKLLAFAGGGGLAVTGLAALGIGAPAFGAITTRRGEVRLVTLDDGSTVVLNTETHVQVRYTDTERRVKLVYGEAYFTTVDNGRRPFVVDVAGTTLRAAPGAFRVRALDDRPVDILVHLGRVVVTVRGAPALVVMEASSRLALPVAYRSSSLPLPRTIAPDMVSRELAWREGKIAFEGTPLDQAAAEFGRYSRVRIAIADPALAREPVTGLFSAADPVGFSRAITNVFDAKMDERGDVVTLSRKADTTRK